MALVMQVKHEQNMKSMYRNSLFLKEGERLKIHVVHCETMSVDRWLMEVDRRRRLKKIQRELCPVPDVQGHR